MKKAIFLLVFAFFISLVVHLPLHVVSKYIPTFPQLVIAGPSGTIWRGTFESVRWQGKNLGALSWKINLRWIFLGRFDIDFNLEGKPTLAANGKLGLGFQGIYAKNVTVNIAASEIDSYIVYPLPMRSNGNLRFSIDDYGYATPWCKTLVGKGRWQNASIQLGSEHIELGDVSADMSCQSGNLFVKSASSSKAIDTNINLTLLPQFRYKVEGSLAAKDDFPSTLRPQLQWLGQPNAQGRYSLAFNG